MKIFVKLAATLVATAIAFCVGFIATGAAYERWYLPDLVKKYPHDGQLGLAVFATSFSGACISAFIVLVVGTVWTGRTSRLSQSSPEQLMPTDPYSLVTLKLHPNYDEHEKEPQ